MHHAKNANCSVEGWQWWLELQKDCGSSEKRQPINYSQKNNLKTWQKYQNCRVFDFARKCQYIDNWLQKSAAWNRLFEAILEFDILMPVKCPFSENLRKLPNQNVEFL